MTVKEGILGLGRVRGKLEKRMDRHDPFVMYAYVEISQKIPLICTISHPNLLFPSLHKAHQSSQIKLTQLSFIEMHTCTHIWST
jgi:hypothetical protein